MTTSERYGDIPKNLVSAIIHPIPYGLPDEWEFNRAIQKKSALKEFAKGFQLSDNSWEFIPPDENLVDFKYTAKDIELLLKRYESGVY